MLAEAIELYENDQYKEAITLFREYAKNNRTSTEAPYYLGLCYFHGNGVDCDQEEAKYWWKIAKKNGSIDAGFMLEQISQSTICRC